MTSWARSISQCWKKLNLYHQELLLWPPQGTTTIYIMSNLSSSSGKLSYLPNGTPNSTSTITLSWEGYYLSNTLLKTWYTMKNTIWISVHSAKWRKTSQTLIFNISNSPTTSLFSTTILSIVPTWMVIAPVHASKTNKGSLNTSPCSIKWGWTCIFQAMSTTMRDLMKYAPQEKS